MRFITTLLLAITLVSCGKIENPEFRRLENFKVEKFGLTETTVSFATTYYNPNKFGVTVKEAAIDLFVDSIYVGKFTQLQEVTVNRGSEFSIPLQGKIALQNALKMDIPHLIGKEVFVQANGKVRVGKTGVFITKDINYSGRQVFDADLLK